MAKKKSRRKKGVRGIRTFNGKKYKCFNKYALKSDARRDADALKRHGNYVRLIRVYKGWGVYFRKK